MFGTSFQPYGVICEWRNWGKGMGRRTPVTNRTYGCRVEWWWRCWNEDMNAVEVHFVACVV